MVSVFSALHVTVLVAGKDRSTANSSGRSSQCATVGLKCIPICQISHSFWDRNGNLTSLCTTKVICHLLDLAKEFFFSFVSFISEGRKSHYCTPGTGLKPRAKENKGRNLTWHIFPQTMPKDDWRQGGSRWHKKFTVSDKKKTTATCATLASGLNISFNKTAELKRCANKNMELWVKYINDMNTYSREHIKSKTHHLLRSTQWQLWDRGPCHGCSCSEFWSRRGQKWTCSSRQRSVFWPDAQSRHLPPPVSCSSPCTPDQGHCVQ